MYHFTGNSAAVRFFGGCQTSAIPRCPPRKKGTVVFGAAPRERGCRQLAVDTTRTRDCECTYLANFGPRGRASRTVRPSSKGPPREVQGSGPEGGRNVGGTVGWATGRAGQVGRQGAEGGCADVLAAKTDGNSPVWRAFGHKTLSEAPCFCFLFRGPGPSDGAGGSALTER